MFGLPFENIEKRADRLAVNFRIVKPEGDGPFPTILMFHGCGRPYVAPEFAQHAKSEGIASIIVNSFAPRNISDFEAATTVCSGIQLRGSERAGDVAAALFWAQSQDWVKKDDIHAAGWSHGAWSIMDALAREEDIGALSHISDYQPIHLQGLKSAFLIYPWCGPGSHSHSRGWRLRTPAHFIVCGRDFVVGDALILQTIDRLKKDGLEIGQTIFEKATHSFDERDSIHPAHKFDHEYLLHATQLLCDFVKNGIA